MQLGQRWPNGRNPAVVAALTRKSSRLKITLILRKFEETDGNVVTVEEKNPWNGRGGDLV